VVTIKELTMKKKPKPKKTIMSGYGKGK